MQVWNVLHAARWKYMTQKFDMCSPSHKFCRAISYQLRHLSIIGKKTFKQQCLLFHMSSQYGELQPTNGWDRLAKFGHPANFNWFRVLAPLLHRRRRSTKLYTMFGRLLRWYTTYIHTFWGSCPLTEFCQVQNSLCVQTLRRSAQGTPIFGRAVITLGIGPHSSLNVLW